MTTEQDPTATGRPTPKNDENRLRDRESGVTGERLQPRKGSQLESDGSAGSDPGVSDPIKTDKGF